MSIRTRAAIVYVAMTFFRDGTAIGGSENEDADFVHSSGVLQFKHQESSKIITVAVNKNIKVCFFLSIHCPIFCNS